MATLSTSVAISFSPVASQSGTPRPNKTGIDKVEALASHNDASNVSYKQLIAKVGTVKIIQPADTMIGICNKAVQARRNVASDLGQALVLRS